MLSPSPFGCTSIRQNDERPASSMDDCNIAAKSSATNNEERLRNCLICFLVGASVTSKSVGLTAKSISSEKRSIRFQALLNDVPPLKTSWSAIGKLNTILRICVTHQSFSILGSGRCFFWAVSRKAWRCSAGVCCKNSIIRLVE